MSSDPYFGDKKGSSPYKSVQHPEGRSLLMRVPVVLACRDRYWNPPWPWSQRAEPQHMSLNFISSSSLITPSDDGEIIIMYESLSRDKYDLHYDRRLPERLATPRGTAAEQPYDSEFDEITDTENAMNGLIKKRNILLNRESQHLKSILDDSLFYFERLKEVDPTAAFGINPDALPRKSSGSRPDAFNERNVLQKRTTEATRFRETLQRKVKAGLDAKVQSFQGVTGENPDVLLYRIQRCPTQTSSAPRFSNSLLADRPSGWNLFGDITNDAILNHMSGAGDPTPMISLEESPARLTALLKNVPDCDTSATNVQVFSVRMLQHLGVPIARSTDLYRDRLIPTADLKKDGLAQGVSGTHWLVTNWLPEEAMVTKLGLLEFLAFARDRGVIDSEDLSMPPKRKIE